MGAVDWDRRVFDSLIPIPEGTSYNAYLVRGTERTALLDTVEPSKASILFEQLSGVEKLDYIVSHHAEQDHSGTIPEVLKLHPEAKVVATAKARTLLADHLGLDSAQIMTVADGDVLQLGGCTLRFLHTPWVHWPETMASYLEEEKILFSCDLFGSHLATSELYATQEERVLGCAKRYYGEIMMPFRKHIAKHLEKFAQFEIGMIAPSHGPVYRGPQLILDAYRDWAVGPPANLAVIAFVSMHYSTLAMTDYLTSELADRGVRVERFDLADVELGKLAEALVDAATIVVGTPTVLGGPHPHAVSAAYLTNLLRPKARFVGVIGSMGWAGKTVDTIKGLIPDLEAELLDPVIVRGQPGSDARDKLTALAATIAERHAAIA